MNAPTDNTENIRPSSLDLLHDINRQLQEINQIDDLCWALTDWVGELCGLDDCVVYLRVGNVLTQMAALGDKRIDDKNTDARTRGIVDRIGLPIGSGIVGAAAATGEPVYVADIASDERYILDVYPGASEYAVPLTFRREVLGVLDCEHREVDGISGLQRQLLRTLAVLAQPHIAELLRKPNYQTLNYSDVIAELAHNTIGKSGDLNTIFGNITERATRTVRVTRSNIWLFDESIPHLLVCEDEYNAQLDAHSRGQSIDTDAVPAYVQALREERVILAINARTDPRTFEFNETYLEPNDIHSMLDAPIRLDGNVVGVLCLEQMHHQRDWTEAESNFVGTLADFATIALASHKKSVAETALIQSQKMESMGRLAGGIAHDFNNLLTVITGAVETIQARNSPQGSEARLLQMVNEASDRARRLTKNLMAFGGQQQLQLETASIRALVEGLEELIQGLTGPDFHQSGENVC